MRGIRRLSWGDSAAGILLGAIDRNYFLIEQFMMAKAAWVHFIFFLHFAIHRSSDAVERFETSVYAYR